MDIAVRIRHYLNERYTPDSRGIQLNDETQILEEKVIDSIGMLELMLFLEETFGVRVPDEDITPENFSTIKHITFYLEGKLNSPS